MEDEEGQIGERVLKHQATDNLEYVLELARDDA